MKSETNKNTLSRGNSENCHKLLGQKHTCIVFASSWFSVFTAVHLEWCIVIPLCTEDLRNCKWWISYWNVFHTYFNFNTSRKSNQVPWCCCSVTKSCLTLSDPMDCSTSSFPVFHGICSDSCPLSQWSHPTISSSVTLLICLQSFPASGSFLMNHLFASCGQSIGASALASVLPMSIQCWFPLGWTGLMSLLSKGLSRLFSSNRILRHQFLGTPTVDFLTRQLESNNVYFSMLYSVIPSNIFSYKMKEINIPYCLSVSLSLS